MILFSLRKEHIGCVYHPEGTLLKLINSAKELIIIVQLLEGNKSAGKETVWEEMQYFIGGVRGRGWDEIEYVIG